MRALRPFRTSAYRVLASALALSLFGTGVWLVALVAQVIALGGGPADLSLVATASSVGLIVTVLLGGVVADRLPQKRILLATETTKVLVAGTAALLAFSGTMQLWHLLVLGTVLGLADGFFYPAYSALLPRVLPAEDLLAANGVEGVLRPSAMQAAGPALAGAVIAAADPAVAILVVACSQLAGVAVLAFLRAPGEPRKAERSAGAAAQSVIADLLAGFRYMVGTRWLLATLLFSCVLVLVVMGPLEVLVPFAVQAQTDAGAAGYAIVLTAFGVGGVAGSLYVSSRRLPRHYLTVASISWALGSLPLAAMGFLDQVWIMAAAAFVVGFSFNLGEVVWGTLLQRRVPAALLGRVSSLDFFVSLGFTPVSMALAGPVAQSWGLAPTFLVAGLVPLVLGTLLMWLGRLRQDELAHPLD